MIKDNNDKKNPSRPNSEAHPTPPTKQNQPPTNKSPPTRHKKKKGKNPEKWQQPQNTSYNVIRVRTRGLGRRELEEKKKRGGKE